MSYTVIVTPEASRQLNALPPLLTAFVRAQLELLALNPTRLSKPTTILQPSGQLFEVFLDTGGVYAWVSIIFRFGADEQTLFVEHVAAELG